MDAVAESVTLYGLISIKCYPIWAQIMPCICRKWKSCCITFAVEICDSVTTEENFDNLRLTGFPTPNVLWNVPQVETLFSSAPKGEHVRLKTDRMSALVRRTYPQES